jgi:hypothetical protein
MLAESLQADSNGRKTPGVVYIMEGADALLYRSSPKKVAKRQVPWFEIQDGSG